MDFYAKPGYATAPHLVVSGLNLALAPAPLPVTPFGSLYVDPNGLIYLPWTSVNPATGKGAVVIRVPDDPSLQGLTVYVQGLVVDLANVSDTHLTNYTADVIMK